MKKKLLEQAKLLPAFNPVTEQAAGAHEGTVIDRLGSDTAVVMVGVGAVSGSPDSFSIAAKIQHGDASNGSDMEDYTDYTLTSLTQINTNTHKGFDLLPLKRYIRVVVTPAFVSGSSPKAYITSAVALGDAVVEPVP